MSAVAFEFNEFNGSGVFIACDCGALRTTQILLIGKSSIRNLMLSTCPACGRPLLPRRAEVMNAALAAEQLGVLLPDILCDIYGLTQTGEDV